MPCRSNQQTTWRALGIRCGSDKNTRGWRVPEYRVHRSFNTRRTEARMSGSKMDAQIGMRRQPMLIGGEWVWAASGESLTVENPGRRTVIAEVPRGGEADVD